MNQLPTSLNRSSTVLARCRDEDEASEGKICKWNTTARTAFLSSTVCTYVTYYENVRTFSSSSSKIVQWNLDVWYYILNYSISNSLLRFSIRFGFGKTEYKETPLLSLSLSVCVWWHQVFFFPPLFLPKERSVTGSSFMVENWVCHVRMARVPHKQTVALSAAAHWKVHTVDAPFMLEPKRRRKKSCPSRIFCL